MPPQPRSVRSTAPRPGAVLVGALALLASLSACSTGSSPSHHSTGATPTGPTSPIVPSVSDSPDGSPGTTSTATTSTSATTTPTGSTSPASPSTPARQKVTVVVTYHDWNTATKAAEASAIVDGVVESGATCTLSLTRNGVIRTVSRRATPSASSTQCGQMSIPGTQLTAGEWSVTVRYDSARAYGSSAPVTMRVGG